MRRLPILCLGIAALAACTTLALPLAPSWTMAPARAALRLATRAMAAAAPAAFAQEVLEFKPIPAESAAAMERRRTQRRAQRASERTQTVARTAPTPAVAPVAPVLPPEPVAPTPPPEPTRVELSRSGNIMRVGNDITIEADQTVVGDVLAVGGDVTVQGHVEGDVVSMGGDIHLEASARVDGDVVCMGGQLHEEEGAVVGGQRVTAAGGRDVRRRILDRDDDGHRRDSSRGYAGAVVWAIITLGVAWAFTSIAPGRTQAAADMMRREPGAATVVGFLGLLLAGPLFLVIIILGALLCITIIGIPLAIAAWCAYGLLIALVWIWGYVVGATVLGQAVLARRGGALPGTPGLAAPAPSLAPLVRAALLGAAIFSGAFVLSRLLKFLPGLGGIATLLGVLSWIATGVFTMVGAGALIRGEWQSGTLLRRWRRQPAPSTVPAAPAAQWYPAQPTLPMTGATPPAPPASPAPPVGDPPPSL